MDMHSSTSLCLIHTCGSPKKRKHIYARSPRLQDPYVLPVLYIRRPGNDTEDVHRFPDDDPFFSEVSNLIDVIEDIEEDVGDGKGLILSSFEDACKTYEFT